MKRTPVALFGLNLYRAAMALDYRITGSQAKSVSLGFCGIKRVENAG
jgi:hypothetical protein